MSEKVTIKINDVSYTVEVQKNVSTSSDAVKIIVVSKILDKSAKLLIDRLIKSIDKFTYMPYELWIVDNNSPEENIDFLKNYKKVNLAFIKSKASESGSFENALGLEIGARLIDKDSKYLMTLHQDTVVCKKDWLEFMLSKFNEDTRAVGVREDKARVNDGVLHVLGYIIDFQLFKELNLSFFPELPKYDVGDKVIIGLKQAGFKVWAANNTIWDPALVDKLNKSSKFREIQVDRALDDKNEVFFMHLGRGVLKSTGEYIDTTKSIEQWISFIDENLLSSRLQTVGDVNSHLSKKLVSELWYSVRRYYIDAFFLENIKILKKSDKVIDLGGKKKNKRGEFDIDEYGFDVKYVNIDESTEPDFLADIKSVPVKDSSFGGVILAEVLEHVTDPIPILNEAYRILQKQGLIFITTPFVYNVHADPYDYARYTDYWYQEKLTEIGFKNIEIYKQGLLFGVISNILKTWAYSLEVDGIPKNKLKKKVFHKFVNFLTLKSLKWDRSAILSKNIIFKNYTTGFAVIARK